MNLKEFGNYLKKIREDKKISLRQVDYSSEVTFSNLSMIEHGRRRATPFVLKELSKVYKIDYIDLLEKAGYIDLAEAEKINDKSSELYSFNKNNIDNNVDINDIKNALQKFYWCPVYGEISAGNPRWAEECLEGYFPIEPELMNIINPQEHYFLRVNR